MSDSTLNEEIARLEIEIDAVRDELDEAIKRNEALEAEVIRLREVLYHVVRHICPGGVSEATLNAALADLYALTEEQPA
jgi:regulator of replication initiation timing